MPGLTALVAVVVATSGGPATSGEDGSSGPQPHSRPGLGTWSPLADLPQERTELSAAVVDDVIYAVGGFTADPNLGSEFFAYHPGSDSWRELAPVPYQLVHHAPLTGYGDSVYLVGGFASEAAGVPALPTDRLLVYDITDGTWRAGPPMPQPVGAHAVATTTDGKIHVVGGVAETVEEGFVVTDAHFVFDIATGTWSSLPPMPTAREHLGAAFLDGVVYVAAGRSGDSTGAELEAYDIEIRQWAKLPDVPTPRGGVAVVAFRGQVYVLGGETFDPLRTYDQAERFDPDRGTWKAVAPMLSPRHGLGGVALHDGIVLVAGGPEAGFTFAADTEIWRPGRGRA